LISSDPDQFIESVLALKPSIAVFDCDGTLWSGDAGADFFYWEIERGLVSREVGEWARARYKEYEAGNVGEEQMCGEMVTMNRGLSREALQVAAEEFFDEVVSHRIVSGDAGVDAALGRSGLRAVGCLVYERLGGGGRSGALWHPARSRAGRFGSHRRRRASDRLIRVPTDELKAVVIREVIGKPMEAVFGNSVHDQAMLEMAKWPFCVNPNPDLEQVARERGWTVYWPKGEEIVR
jgi:phosphoserine phosphatase